MPRWRLSTFPPAAGPAPYVGDPTLWSAVVRVAPLLAAALLLAAGLAGCAERDRLPPIDGAGGHGRVVVDDAPAGRTVELLDGDAVVAIARADGEGRAVFVGLGPGLGYRVRLAAADLRGPASGTIPVGPRAPALVGEVTAAIVAGAEPGASIQLLRDGSIVAEAVADDAGRAVVRNLTAGVGYRATQTVLGMTGPGSQATSVAPAASGGPDRVTVAGAEPGATVVLLRIDGDAGPDPRRDPTIDSAQAGPDGHATFTSTADGDRLPAGPGYYALQRTDAGTTRPSNVVTVG